MRVAYIVPSSKALIRRVCSKMDFSRPKVIVEFGPGEGCHTRELLKRMHPESRLLLFELDTELADHLREQFQADPRVEIFNIDAGELPRILAEREIPHCDYVVSGIPFSILEIGKKRELLQSIFESLAHDPESAFVIYQVTAELRQHAKHFPRIESEYCLQNLPPMFVIKFYKQGLNGHASHGAHCNCAHNGHKNGAKKH